MCFPVLSYPFLDRFFHLKHADFNEEHLSYLNKTNWPLQVLYFYYVYRKSLVSDCLILIEFLLLEADE
jgi:hypothetical protein